MRIVKQPAGFGEPFSRFPNNNDAGNSMRLSYRDPDHTPDNKRAGEVDSTFTMMVDRNIKGEWVSIEFGEITTTDSGRTSMRTISKTLKVEDVLKLADFLRGVKPE